MRLGPVIGKVLGAVAFCLAESALAAGPPGDARLGRELAVSERCVECHVAGGPGIVPSGRHAKLAGQSAAYLAKQLRDYRGGQRRHEVMSVLARDLDDTDIAHLAAYFAGEPAMRGEGMAADAVAAAKSLYLQGDAARGIAACAACHGERGEGLALGGNVVAPVIKGQERLYLEKQLHDWRTGERNNAADGAMGQAVQALTDRDIEALAAYLSGL